MWNKRRNGESEHRRVGELLSAYLDGRVTGDEQAAVDRHLATCADCRRDLDELRWTVGLLREMPAVPVPRSFAIPAAQPRPASGLWAWLAGDRGFVFLRGATALATALLVVVVGLDLLRPATMPTPMAMPAAQEVARELDAGAGRRAEPAGRGDGAHGQGRPDRRSLPDARAHCREAGLPRRRRRLQRPSPAPAEAEPATAEAEGAAPPVVAMPPAGPTALMDQSAAAATAQVEAPAQFGAPTAAPAALAAAATPAPPSEGGIGAAAGAPAAELPSPPSPSLAAESASPPAPVSVGVEPGMAAPLAPGEATDPLRPAGLLLAVSAAGLAGLTFVAWRRRSAR